MRSSVVGPRLMMLLGLSNHTTCYILQPTLRGLSFPPFDYFTSACPGSCFKTDSLLCCFPRSSLYINFNSPAPHSKNADNGIF